MYSQARSQEFFVGGATVGPLIFEPLLTFIRGGVVGAISKFDGGGRIRDFRLSLSWVVGKIRGGG